MSTQIQFSDKELIKKGSEITGINQAWLAKNGVRVLFWAVAAFLLFQGWQAIGQDIVNMVWGTVEIFSGVVVCLVILPIIIGLWKHSGLLSEIIADKIFFGIIRNAPFIMQEKQIRRAEQDMDRMVSEKEKIEGKFIELSQKVQKAQQDVLEATEGVKIAQAKHDEDLTMDQNAKRTRATRVIESLGPLVNNMEFIISFVNEGTKILKRRIRNAKQDLETNKDIYESVRAGSGALERMKQAMVGDVQLNNDAERAQVEAMKAIALSIGQMKTSMEIISEVTKEANIEDASKMMVARNKLQALNVMPGQAIPLQQNANFKGVVHVKDTRFDMPLD
jgi:hypothetical protein